MKKLIEKCSYWSLLFIIIFKEIWGSSFYYATNKCYFWKYDVKIDFNIYQTSFWWVIYTLYTITWIVLYIMQVLKGIIFCCLRFYRRTCYNVYKNFTLICFLFDVTFLVWKRFTYMKNCNTYFEESKLSKTCQNSKFR